MTQQNTYLYLTYPKAHIYRIVHVDVQAYSYNFTSLDALETEKIRLNLDRQCFVLQVLIAKSKPSKDWIQINFENHDTFENPFCRHQYNCIDYLVFIYLLFKNKHI